MNSKQLNTNSRLGLAAARILLTVAAVALPTLVVHGSAADDEKPAAAVQEVSAAQQWGVEIVGLRRSAAGHLLDLRYRVNDAERAAPLHERQTKPYLLDQATGARLVVPAPAKTGALRNSNAPQAGRVYPILFSNPGGMVEAGARVTLVIGNLRVENLIVE